MIMQNSRQKILFGLVLSLLLVGTGFLGISNGFAQQESDKPFSGHVVDPQEATPFQLTATVMEVNNKVPRHVVVAEKVILVTSYKIENEVKTTAIVNAYGSPITIEQLKDGERVIVQGLKLKDDTLIGTHIQAKPKKK